MNALPGGVRGCMHVVRMGLADMDCLMLCDYRVNIKGRGIAQLHDRGPVGMEPR